MSNPDAKKDQPSEDNKNEMNKAKNPELSIAKKSHDLFGGAFTVEQFPATFRDISDIVPVSDNQEIFSDLNEGNPAYSGNQLIIEVLERTDNPDNEAIQFHFQNLAEDTNATDAT